jgi:hypothetical protein
MGNEVIIMAVKNSSIRHVGSTEFWKAINESLEQ